MVREFRDGGGAAPRGQAAARAAIAVAAWLLGGALAARAADEPCPIERFPDVAVTFIRNHPAVPVGINGRFLFFLLDTGFTKTAVTPATQARFQLPVDARFRAKTNGTGGTLTAPYVSVKRFEFSGQTYIDPTFPVIGISRETGPNDPPDLFAGVIGGDFLRNYDVEFDFAHQAMRLYRRPPCRPALPACSAPYQTIPVRVGSNNAVVLPVTVNGSPLRALFDTGATEIVLRSAALADARIDPASLRGDRIVGTVGAGGLAGRAWVHRLERLEIGNERFLNPTVWIQDFKLADGEMLLGTPYTRAHKVWLAYSANLMFVQPETP